MLSLTLCEKTTLRVRENYSAVSGWMMHASRIPYAESASKAESVELYHQDVLLVDPFHGVHCIRYTVIEGTGCEVSVPLIRKIMTRGG